MTLIITKKDEAVFEKLAQQRFIKELHQYGESVSPYWVKIMEDKPISAALDEFIDRTKALGLEERASYYLYFGTSLLLGGLFYDDDQYQPLMERVNDNNYGIEAKCIEKLYQVITDYMQKVVGEKNAFLQNAVERLGQLETFRLKEDDFNSEILVILKHFYPEKVEYIESEHYHSFIEWGKIRAQNNYALTHPNQWATYIMLMFYLGQYFDKDPFFMWFDWSKRLEEIHQNQFSFKKLSDNLLMIWEFKEKNNVYNT